MRNGSEALKFLRTILLMSLFYFGSRRNLCTTDSKHKYVPASKLGNIMHFSMFESMRGNIRFSDGRPPGIEGHTNRWKLVDDFI